MANWQKYTVKGTDKVTYFADRPNGIEMDVTHYIENGEHLYEIYVYDPNTNTEFLLGDLEDTDINSCMERAESVNLPDEDTGS